MRSENLRSSFCTSSRHKEQNGQWLGEPRGSPRARSLGQLRWPKSCDAATRPFGRSAEKHNSFRSLNNTLLISFTPLHEKIQLLYTALQALFMQSCFPFSQMFSQSSLSSRGITQWLVSICLPFFSMSFLKHVKKVYVTQCFSFFSSYRAFSS